MSNTGEIIQKHIYNRPATITQNDIKVLDELMHRTETIPDVLHLRAAEPGYEFTDADKKFVMDVYSNLDDILKEVAAFINIKFPGCERHVAAWNEIDFDTKIGKFKIITTDREEIRRAWKRGMFDLKSLIKALRNEAVLLAREWDDTGLVQLINPNSPTETKEKQSWIEILSWIAGILGTLISLYALLK